jgi:hypothetical protein
MKKQKNSEVPGWVVSQEGMLLQADLLPIVHSFQIDLFGQSLVTFGTTVPHLWNFNHRPNVAALAIINAPCTIEDAEKYCLNRNMIYLARQLFYVAKKMGRWLQHYSPNFIACQNMARHLQAGQVSFAIYQQYADELAAMRTKLCMWQMSIASQMLSECNRLASALLLANQKTAMKT